MSHESPPPLPRRTLALLRAVLPNDPFRDAIVGDLHEEFVHDADRLGVARAQERYRARAFGVVAHALVDVVRWRRWASTTPPAASAAAGPRHVVQPRPRLGRLGRLGGADVGVGAVAFGVLAVGIVVNTLLFTATRSAPAPNVIPAAPATSAALGLGAAALALACAGAAAVVLCAGPRWLRRRLHRRGAPPCAERLPNETA